MSFRLYLSDPAIISADPTDSVQVAGTGFLVLSCHVQGLPIPTVTWLKDGQVLSTDSHVTITEGPLIFIPNEQEARFGIGSSSVIIGDLLLSDDGNYVCRAQNTGAQGNTFTVDSAAANITVECKQCFTVGRAHFILFHVLLADPPLVMVTPSSVIVNQTSTVTLTCQVFGIPTPNVTWTRSSTNVPLATSSTLAITSTTTGNNVTSTLIITQITRSDMDAYICSGSNGRNNFINSPEEDSSQVQVQGDQHNCIISTCDTNFVNIFYTHGH